MATSLTPAQLLILAVVLLVVGALLFRAWTGAMRSSAAHARADRALAGESTAPALLVEAGFRILGAQVAHSYELLLDGEPVRIDLRADFVVEQGGRRFVADVKTGASAPSITTAATRRQLLEYLVAFEADGVLLVDAETATVREVEFPLAERRG